MNAPERLTGMAQATARPASVAWVEALSATASIEAHPERLLCHIIEERAATHGAAPALLSDIESFSFAELSARIDAYAAWAHAEGLRKGDCVALVMSNRPEYVAIWMGLSKLGIVTALINVNLSGRSLAHCLGIASPRCAIVESGFMQAVTECLAGSGQSLDLWCHGASATASRRIDTRLHTLPAIAGGGSDVTVKDRALLIYTSGTTGLPKAAHVSHRRILNWALWFKGMLGNTEADRMYDCLPLYHSVGGIVAVAATLVAGGSTVIAEKFSARRFWPDIRRWNCTQFQYIGELCRYLLNAAETPEETGHAIRVACGNGLRADVWTLFRQRFGIPQVLEFYAATEGSFSLFNAEGKPGAIGRVPPFLRHRFPTAIVRFDPDTGKPQRDENGFCIAAAHGEAGEAIGRIGGADGSGHFEGYTDRDESERKILRNVFKQGDMWFRTGDLMRVDPAGYYSFVDRVGDTFRWKGENVSTLEVANVLSSAPGVDDVTVYGVAVPGADGKAGMAFLQVGKDFDPVALLRHASGQLPAYAVPLFLRIGSAMALTETFKHKKQDLVREGFDPAASDDAVYVRLDSAYVRIDGDLFRRITEGAVRL